MKEIVIEDIGLDVVIKSYDQHATYKWALEEAIKILKRELIREAYRNGH